MESGNVTIQSVLIDIRTPAPAATLYISEKRGHQSKPVACQIPVEPVSLDDSLQDIIDRGLKVMGHNAS